MKQVKFNLDNLFRLSSISAIQTFEFENNSAEILISTDVKDELAYELHIENSEGKSFVILDKGEKHISCILTSGMLKVGVNKIQLRGIGENDYIIESNSAEFIVRSFINANVEPTPEEQTAFERLVVKVNIIDNDVEGLKGDVDGINRELENKADKSDIPTKTSELENDSDFITSKDIPTVPTKTSQLTNDSGFITSRDIPTIPTKTSQLENDSEFVTKSEIPAVPSKVSELENDSGYVTESAIPTKVSQLENDSEFVTKQQLDSKMEFYKLDYVGGLLSHEGVVLNYAQIIEKFNDNKYFLYAEGDGFVYIPTLPPLPGDEIIEFSSSYIYGGKNYMSRIIINSENQVKWEEIEVVRATDFKDLQSEVKTIEDNKVSAITEENKSSTENYPSNKAMTDYVAEHGAVSDVQINGTTIVSEGVANIPNATTEEYGVVKIGSGLQSHAGTNNKLSVYQNKTQNKLLSDGSAYVPTKEFPTATFYALAKASGTDEKNSTLPLGQYTEGAQASIQRMIGLGDIKESVEDLWLLNKDISYKVTNQLESGMNVAPKGMFAESLLDVRGKSDQESTNGYQLFDVNSLVLSNPTYMSLEIDGKKTVVRSTGGSYTYAYCRVAVNEGETLTLSYEDIDLSQALSGTLRVRYSDDDNVSKGYLTISSGSKSISGTVPSGATRADVQLYINNTSTSSSAIGTFIGVMLEKGSVAHEYEPYTGGTPSPNTNYPQPIYSVEEIHIDVNGVKRTIIPPFALNKIGEYYDNADIDKGVWTKVIKTITESDYAHSIDREPSYFILDTSIETPISASDLDYLKSLQKLKDNSVITITDQNGNDISFLMEYIIKLSEVN